MEKALKAVLYARQIEFERVHDLVKLANLLGDQSLTLSVSVDQLRLLNPFAVTFGYDDIEIEEVIQEELDSQHVKFAVKPKIE